MIVVAAAGLVIGMALGALGGGGAVLAVPALVYLVGQDVHEATTTSLLVVAVAAVAGGAGQVERGQVCWPQVGLFAPTAILGSVIGTVANEAADATVLLVAFAGVMLAAAAFTWRKAEQPDPGPSAACPPLRARRTLAAGLLVGGLTGFLGVGGGFLVVPLLALGLRFPLRRAIGTSLIIVGVISLAGFTAHLVHGGRSFDAGVAAAMAGACAAGALGGGRIGARLPQHVLGRAFAAIVAATAVYVLLAVAVSGGPPGTG